MKEDKLMSVFGWIVSYFALMIVAVLMSGWALSTIWGWLIVPIFNIAPLSIFQAYGVSMVFSLFTGTNYLSKNTDNSGKSALEVFITSVVTSVVSPALSVFIAWTIHQFAF